MLAVDGEDAENAESVVADAAVRMGLGDGGTGALLEASFPPVEPAVDTAAPGVVQSNLPVDRLHSLREAFHKFLPCAVPSRLYLGDQSKPSRYCYIQVQRCSCC